MDWLYPLSGFVVGVDQVDLQRGAPIQGKYGPIFDASLAHRFELFNRSQLFAWVSERGLHAVAAGDTHTPEHIFGWKTLIPCARHEQAIVSYLRSARPVYLARLEEEHRRLAA